MNKFEQAIRNIDAFLDNSEGKLASYRIWTIRGIIDEALSEDKEDMLRENEQSIEALKQSEQEAQEIIAELKYKNKGLKQEVKELKEWQEANQPTGICETCTAKSVEYADKCRKVLNEIEQYVVDYAGLYFDEICCYEILAILDKVKEN